MSTTTASASLAHWSEAGRSGMDAFYHLATVDYFHLAQSQDWAAFFQALQAGRDTPLKLLDVACGSGKFPAALMRHAGLGSAGLAPIDYALLDPSGFSIAEARGVLEPPFVAADEYELPLQALDVPAGAFDVVWATHALYAIPAAELPEALSKFLGAMGGPGFIAHAKEASHYIRFDRMFREALGKSERVPYSTGEEVVAALEALGAKVSVETITYETTASAEDRAQVEGFLQRCVFDDTLSLAEMEADPVLGAYLAKCQREDRWAFQQSVALISITA